MVSKNYLPASGLRKQKVTSVFKFLSALMNDWMDVSCDIILWLYRSAMFSVLCCCLHQSLHLSLMFALWQVHWETDGRGPGSCGEEENPTDTAEGEALRVYGSIPSVMHSSTAHMLLSGYNFFLNFLQYVNKLCYCGSGDISLYKKYSAATIMSYNCCCWILFV